MSNSSVEYHGLEFRRPKLMLDSSVEHQGLELAITRMASPGGKGPCSLPPFAQHHIDAPQHHFGRTCTAWPDATNALAVVSHIQASLLQTVWKSVKLLLHTQTPWKSVGSLFHIQTLTAPKGTALSSGNLQTLPHLCTSRLATELLHPHRMHDQISGMHAMISKSKWQNLPPFIPVNCTLPAGLLMSAVLQQRTFQAHALIAYLWRPHRQHMHIGDRIACDNCDLSIKSQVWTHTSDLITCTDCDFVITWHGITCALLGFIPHGITYIHTHLRKRAPCLHKMNCKEIDK